MSLAVAIQMDPIESVDIEADSTFALALEAQARGHALFHYLPQNLSLRGGRVLARAQPLEVRRRAGNFYRSTNRSWRRSVNLRNGSVTFKPSPR